MASFLISIQWIQIILSSLLFSIVGYPNNCWMFPFFWTNPLCLQELFMYTLCKDYQKSLTLPSCLPAVSSVLSSLLDHVPSCLPAGSSVFSSLLETIATQVLQSCPIQSLQDFNPSSIYYFNGSFPSSQLQAYASFLFSLVDYGFIYYCNQPDCILHTCMDVSTFTCYHL